MKKEYFLGPRLDRKHFWIVQILIAAVLLLIGGIYVWFEVWTADIQKRNTLLIRTRLMSEAFDTEVVKVLSGSSSDLGKPEYQRIKKQLTLLKKDNPDIRFIYLMGCRSDGAIIFFADSESPDSPDYSPPGQLYFEGSADLQKKFQGGKGIPGRSHL